jgi:hypothetical protein
MYPGGQWYSISNCTCYRVVGIGELVFTIDVEFVDAKLKALTTKAYFAAVVKF